jgi:hypothetical protein
MRFGLANTSVTSPQAYGYDDYGLPLSYTLEREPTVLLHIQSMHHKLNIDPNRIFVMYSDLNNRIRFDVYRSNKAAFVGHVDLFDYFDQGNEQFGFHPHHTDSIIKLDRTELWLVKTK